MSLKIWYLALTLFLIVTVSGVVRGVNWGIDAQGNIVDYNNLNPTTPSYKAAKEAFLTDELKLQITNYFKSPGNLKYIKDAIAGDRSSCALHLRSSSRSRLILSPPLLRWYLV